MDKDFRNIYDSQTDTYVLRILGTGGDVITSRISLEYSGRAFTVGVADLEHLVACDYVGIVSANKEADKMKKAGFTTTKGEFVNAPIINELPLTLECELVKVIDGSKYLAEIKNVSADEKYLGDDGEIDLSKFTPITYDPVHHGYYRLFIF